MSNSICTGRAAGFSPLRMPDIGSRHATWFREVGAITHQTADGSGLATLIRVKSIEV
jgi:hypothetical protein